MTRAWRCLVSKGDVCASVGRVWSLWLEFVPTACSPHRFQRRWPLNGSESGWSCERLGRQQVPRHWPVCLQPQWHRLGRWNPRLLFHETEGKACGPSLSCWLGKQPLEVCGGKGQSSPKVATRTPVGFPCLFQMYSVSAIQNCISQSCGRMLLYLRNDRQETTHDAQKCLWSQKYFPTPWCGRYR